MFPCRPPGARFELTCHQGLPLPFKRARLFANSTMNVIHRQHLPPSGAEFSCQASLTPSTLSRYSDTILSSKSRPKPITNLIVARSTLLQVFELCLLDQDESGHSHPRFHEQQETKNKNYKLFHICEHRLHGRVTGLQRLTTLDTQEDGLDRLLVSFQDAKVRVGRYCHYDRIPPQRVP